MDLIKTLVRSSTAGLILLTLLEFNQGDNPFAKESETAKTKIEKTKTEKREITRRYNSSYLEQVGKERKQRKEEKEQEKIKVKIISPEKGTLRFNSDHLEQISIQRQRIKEQRERIKKGREKVDSTQALENIDYKGNFIPPLVYFADRKYLTRA